jgi:hypothetical protein
MVMITLEQATKTYRGSRFIALLFFNLDGVGGQHHANPGRFTLGNRRLDGPHSWSGRVRKVSPSPRFDPRTVQEVASDYTG